MLRKPWGKVAYNFPRNTRIAEAGTTAGWVYLYLILRNQEGDFDGVLPAREVTVNAIRSGAAACAEISHDVTGDASRDALRSLRHVGAVTLRDDGSLEIVAWDEWRPSGAKTDAERQRDCRARKKAEKAKNRPSRKSRDKSRSPSRDASRQEKRREEKSINSPKVPAGDGKVSSATAEVIAAFGRAFDLKLDPAPFERLVQKRLAAGATVAQMVGVCWWAGERWANDPAWQHKADPSWLLQTKFGRYLSLATALWRKKSGSEPPWMLCPAPNGHERDDLLDDDELAEGTLPP